MGWPLDLMNPSRLIVHRSDMNANEIRRLYSEGFRLTCRYCKIEFSTIPESLRLGETPVFVACPNNINHMHLVSDTKREMEGVRKIMNKLNES